MGGFSPQKILSTVQFNDISTSSPLFPAQSLPTKLVPNYQERLPQQTILVSGGKENTPFLGRRGETENIIIKKKKELAGLCCKRLHRDNSKQARGLSHLTRGSRGHCLTRGAEEDVLPAPKGCSVRIQLTSPTLAATALTEQNPTPPACCPPQGEAEQTSPSHTETDHAPLPHNSAKDTFRVNMGGSTFNRV